MPAFSRNITVSSELSTDTVRQRLVERDKERRVSQEGMGGHDISVPRWIATEKDRRISIRFQVQEMAFRWPPSVPLVFEGQIEPTHSGSCIRGELNPRGSLAAQVMLGALVVLYPLVVMLVQVSKGTFRPSSLLGIAIGVFIAAANFAYCRYVFDRASKDVVEVLKGMTDGSDVSALD